MILVVLAGLTQAVLLAVTLISAIREARASHERGRTDVALFMTALAMSSFGPRAIPLMPALAAVSFGALPLLTLRLVSHFRAVPRLAWLVASAFLAVSMVFAVAAPPLGWTLTLPVAAAVLFVAAGWMLAECRRSQGGRRHRTQFVAIGIFLLACVTVAGSPLHFTSYDVQAGFNEVASFVNAVIAVCFFLGFATPRFLTTRWRRIEQGAYLAQTADREPEERGHRAAGDLFDAANRCVGGTVAFVALAESPQAQDLVVVAGGGPTLSRVVVAAGPGLLNRVRDTGVAELGTPASCELEVSAAVAAFGRTVLVAPVQAVGRAWGVVVAIHRRGALFPEDDLTALAQLGRIAATALDHAALIRERREEIQRASEGRLRALESRVELMLESIRDYALFVTDEDGAVAAWHPGAVTLFGHSRDSIARQSASWLFDLPGEAFRSWLEESARAGVTEREGTCRRSNGDTFVGVTTIRPLVAEAGSPGGFVIVTHDVTERRNLEERLRQGQKMQAIGQLAGGVAHDFNNLLTAILGYADWLEQELAGDPRRSHVTEIQRAAERAADLTRQLLAFSRKQMLQPVPVNLSRLIGELLPMLRRLIGEAIAIVDTTVPSIAPVMGDRSQVEQVILNLVLNARDAMPDGGRITIRTTDVWRESPADLPEHGGPFVLLEVSDTGMGMDAETRRRAFEPFFTTKDVGRGTGLGLSTVYGIVQQMGGVIDIDSSPGQGATFRLYLPHASADVVNATRADGDGLVGGRETVLLVEDDPTLRPYLVQVLARNGYHVLAAESSEAALQLTEALQYPIDLVISDVAMPGRSGPELVAELLKFRPGLPALYISGHPDGVGGLPDGAGRGDLLRKPFSSTDLLTKVRQIVRAA